MEARRGKGGEGAEDTNNNIHNDDDNDGGGGKMAAVSQKRGASNSSSSSDAAAADSSSSSPSASASSSSSSSNRSHEDVEQAKKRMRTKRLKTSAAVVSNTAQKPMASKANEGKGKVTTAATATAPIKKRGSGSGGGGGGGGTKGKEEGKVSHEQRWKEMFHRLCVYKHKNGNCLVPNRHPEDPALGCWVSAQRRQYKIVIEGGTSSMTQERAEQLESIGFEWSTTNPHHTPWETRYAELCRFKQRFGHAEVPMRWQENAQLSHWVSKQRHDYKLRQCGKSSRLNDKKIQLLNDIGFCWEGSRRSFKEKLNDTGIESDEVSSGGYHAGGGYAEQSNHPVAGTAAAASAQAAQQGSLLGGGASASAQVPSHLTLNKQSQPVAAQQGPSAQPAGLNELLTALSAVQHQPSQAQLHASFPLAQASPHLNLDSSNIHLLAQLSHLFTRQQVNRPQQEAALLLQQLAQIQQNHNQQAPHVDLQNLLQQPLLLQQLMQPQILAQLQQNQIQQAPAAAVPNAGLQNLLQQVLGGVQPHQMQQQLHSQPMLHLGGGLGSIPVMIGPSLNASGTNTNNGPGQLQLYLQFPGAIQALTPTSTSGMQASDGPTSEAPSSQQQNQQNFGHQQPPQNQQGNGNDSTT